MLNCPNCNTTISDEAKFCPHCGQSIKKDNETLNSNEVAKNEEIETEEIKADPIFYEDDITNKEQTVITMEPDAIQNTGTPTQNSETAKNTEPYPYFDKVKNKPNKKLIMKIVIIAVAAIFVIAGAGTGCLLYHNHMVKEQARIAAINNRNTYIDNLKLAINEMNTSATKAESLCDLTYSVWGNSINEKSDAATDKYTKKSNGEFYSDFNDAINALYAADNTLTTLANLETSQTTMQDLMEKLKNPPKDCKDCYSSITDLYAAYTNLVNLAISPSGSYNTYLKNETDKIDSFKTSYTKSNTLLPEKTKIN